MTLDNDPSPDQVAQLAQEIYNNDLLQALVLNISKLDFEVCKKESSVDMGNVGVRNSCQHM